MQCTLIRMQCTTALLRMQCALIRMQYAQQRTKYAYMPRLVHAALSYSVFLCVVMCVVMCVVNVVVLYARVLTDAATYATRESRVQTHSSGHIYMPQRLTSDVWRLSC